MNKEDCKKAIFELVNYYESILININLEWEKLDKESNPAMKVMLENHAIGAAQGFENGLEKILKEVFDESKVSGEE